MTKRKKAPDPLLPLVRAISALWDDHLADLLFNGAERLTPTDVARRAFGPAGKHGRLLYESIGIVNDESLVFYRLGKLRENPLDPDNAQHRVMTAMLSIYGFVCGWVYGGTRGVTPEEVWRQRQRFNETRNLVLSIRFALSDGEHRDTLEDDLDLVTLGQAAGIVHRKKKTLQGYVDRMPRPHVQGAGGKPTLWKWDDLKPWLEKEFVPDLPAKFPGNLR